MATAAEITIVRTTDGIPLRDRLRRVERSQRLKAMGLVAPLFLFIVVTFILPIGFLMFRSIDNPELVEHMPRTVATLQSWDGMDLPGEEVYAAFAADLKEMQANKT
ncbi:MAG: ABC transporter permease, partial [Gammaproteobacteria bacterium]